MKPNEFYEWAELIEAMYPDQEPVETHTTNKMSDIAVLSDVSNH